MGKNTSIKWTWTRLQDGSWRRGHTFNPWIGCSKISPACDHCYAEGDMDHRFHLVKWGGERRRTGADNWKKPLA
jgi:protein gp37